jgi:hypothetical protein
MCVSGLFQKAVPDSLQVVVPVYLVPTRGILGKMTFQE